MKAETRQFIVETLIEVRKGMLGCGCEYCGPKRDHITEAIAALSGFSPEAQALRAQLAAERARFDWWFGTTAKGINEYLRGVRERWSVEQWRVWIDAARSEASTKEGA